MTVLFMDWGLGIWRREVSCRYQRDGQNGGGVGQVVLGKERDHSSGSPGMYFYSFFPLSLFVFRAGRER